MALDHRTDNRSVDSGIGRLAAYEWDDHATGKLGEMVCRQSIVAIRVRVAAFADFWRLTEN